MMRGYLTFLLVFVSVLFILVLINASQKAYDISFSKAIAGERAYQVQMNAKEVVHEAIREGGLSGFRLYNKTHDVNLCYAESGGSPEHPLCFRIEEAKVWAKAGAYLYLASVDSRRLDPDMEISLSCTGSLSEDAARSIAVSRRTSAGYCPGCKNFSKTGKNTSGFANGLISSAPKDKGGNPEYREITGPDCMEFIYPVIEEDPGNALRKPGRKENPLLKSIKLQGFILSSLYYSKFSISSVSYVPSGYEVFP